MNINPRSISEIIIIINQKLINKLKKKNQIKTWDKYSKIKNGVQFFTGNN